MSSDDSSDEVDGDEGSETHKARREGGVRQATSDTVVFRAGGETIEGWALNVSRGGLRAILEQQVEVGDEFSVAVGDGDERPGRVVWVRQEKGGVIVGVAFADAGSAPPPPLPTVPPAAGPETDSEA